MTIRHVVSAVASGMSNIDISRNKIQIQAVEKNEINQQSDFEV